MKNQTGNILIAILFIAGIIGYYQYQENKKRDERQQAEREEYEQRLLAQKTEDEAKAEKLKAEQDSLKKKLQEQQEQLDLQKLAETTPITISDIVILNITQKGTTISNGPLFKKDEIRFIAWATYFTDNVVKAGGKTFGSVYTRYMRQNDDNKEYWTVLNNSGSFTEDDGIVRQYSQKINMVDNGKETGYWSHSMGSESGYDYSVGKWKLELYWDQNNLGKAIYLGGKDFEVY